RFQLLLQFVRQRSPSAGQRRGPLSLQRRGGTGAILLELASASATFTRRLLLLGCFGRRGFACGAVFVLSRFSLRGGTLRFSRLGGCGRLGLGTRQVLGEPLRTDPDARARRAFRAARLLFGLLPSFAR